jgi:serine/threonine-protein kinase
MDESFVQIVYAKIKSNGKTELVPIKLYYADGSFKNLNEEVLSLSENSNEEKLLANRYALQKVLGQGGFGRTYLTLDRYRFDETCVIKEFLPQQQNNYEAQKSSELFAREAKILHQINHPQIPKFYACFEERGKLYLVQEFIRGQTYAALLRARRQQGKTFSEPEVIKLLQDLLPVLSYLHDLQILHRDISLDNIMCQDGSQLPVLIDFGIGRSILVQSQSENSSVPLSNQPKQSIVGKIGYAPYEQIWLGQSFPSSDLYALAMCAIVMLSGFKPQALTQQPALKETWHVQAAVSDGLANILNKMVQDIPANRYQTAQEVLAELERLTGDSAAILNQQSDNELALTTRPTPQTVYQPQVPAPNNLPTTFIAQCEQELINYVGPIGKFLVKNALAQEPNCSQEDLIDLLAASITQPMQAKEFREHLRPK